uniref:Uncharacterized protein n=1 Tax=Setaria italica TaxID=4555 RepID=K4A4B2_SETIT
MFIQQENSAVAILQMLIELTLLSNFTVRHSLETNRAKQRR